MAFFWALEPAAVRLPDAQAAAEAELEGPPVVGAPHAVDELLACEHAAGVAQQDLEELELLQRQRNRVAVDRDAVPLDVHPHRAGLECRSGRLLGLASASQHRPHARDELAVA